MNKRYINLLLLTCAFAGSVIKATVFPNATVTQQPNAQCLADEAPEMCNAPLSMSHGQCSFDEAPKICDVPTPSFSRQANKASETCPAGEVKSQKPETCANAPLSMSYGQCSSNEAPTVSTNPAMCANSPLSMRYGQCSSDEAPAVKAPEMCDIPTSSFKKQSNKASETCPAGEEVKSQKPETCANAPLSMSYEQCSPDDAPEMCDARSSFMQQVEKASGTCPSGYAVAKNPAKRNVFIFSQNIDAPIYNLSLQRALLPLSHNTGTCPWVFSVAPYGKTNQTQVIEKNTHLENFEAGALVHGGYYGTYWFANATAAVNGIQTDAHVGTTDKIHEFRFGVQDALFALGLKTDKTDADWSAYGEWFFGLSANRLGDDKNEKVVKDIIFNVGNPSTGVQAGIDWTFAEFDNCKFELSALSRFTHFFKKDIEIGQKNVSYTPGSYVDALIGFTQYYGSQYQHRIELGYNPTVRVIKAVVDGKQVESDTIVKLNDPESDKVRHTVYGQYSYDFGNENLPMTIGIGGSATIIPHANTYGTVFGTFSVAF